MGFIMKLTPRQEAIVARFEEADVKYFHKVMTKTTVTEVVKGPFAYQLEFPLQFVEDHGHEFDEKATLEKGDTGKEWPLVITVRHFKTENKKRVFAYGDGGWRDYVMQNDLRVGDFLVFQLVGFSRFRVYMQRVTGGHHHERPQASPHSPRNRRLAPAEEEEEAADAEAPDETNCTCAACGQSPPCRARFVTTVMPKIEQRLRGRHPPEVPVGFLQRHGGMLQGDFVFLKGPNEVVMKLMVKYRPDKRLAIGGRAWLDAGWDEFFEANQLVLGDNLLFRLTGPSRFDVEVLDRNLCV